METRTEKLICPFCKHGRIAKVVNFQGCRYFASPISDAVKGLKVETSLKGRFLQANLPCKCGASWYVGGGEIPKGHVAVKLNEEIVAVKRHVTINEVKLRGKKKGQLYHWKQMQLKFPRAFQIITPGIYTVYHEGNDIILRPVTDAK